MLAILGDSTCICHQLISHMPKNAAFKIKANAPPEHRFCNFSISACSPCSVRACSCCINRMEQSKFCFCLASILWNYHTHSKTSVEDGCVLIWWGGWNARKSRLHPVFWTDPICIHYTMSYQFFRYQFFNEGHLWEKFFLFSKVQP